MNPITSFLVLIFMLAGFATGYWVNPYLAPLFFVAAAIIALSLKMANAWQKFVILRMDDPAVKLDRKQEVEIHKHDGGRGYWAREATPEAAASLL